MCWCVPKPKVLLGSLLGLKQGGPGMALLPFLPWLHWLPPGMGWGLGWTLGFCQAPALSAVLHTSRDSLGGALKYNMLAKQITSGDKWYKYKFLAKIWVSAYFSAWANYFNPISHVTANLICTWRQMTTSQLQLPSLNFILGPKVQTIFSQTSISLSQKKKKKKKHKQWEGKRQTQNAVHLKISLLDGG